MYSILNNNLNHFIYSFIIKILKIIFYKKKKKIAFLQ